MYFAEAYEYLLSLGHETLTIKLGLKNTETLLKALGDPHRAFHSVQIAGTNGKGSTAIMLESICRATGIRTGLFTSPHLLSITERVRINGEQISETEFARLTERVRKTAEELVRRGELQTLPTFFEHVTAIALLAFREAKVEMAILETGLGGRLDSTTAAGAEIVAITPIGMDHEEYLGDTLPKIAAEKAATIHPGVTAIVAPQEKAAMDVILRRCGDVGVRPQLIDDVESRDSQLTMGSAHYRSRFCHAPADGRMCVTFETPATRFENVCLGLRGRHQITNAATAIALADALREHGFEISRDAITEGLQNAVHPGRLELWDGMPPILLDGAHNPAAARALRDYLDEFVNQPVTMIFGAMRDKALDEIAALLFPAANQIVLTPLDNPRAATVEQLAASAPSDFDHTKLHEAKFVEEAWRIAHEITNPSELILVTGSLYLVGAVQRQCAI
jgi:dihydrofolate synthase / folylpolyglutamate synthase